MAVINTHKPRLYLASQSPRRAQLLTQAAIDFIPLDSAIDERPLTGELPPIYVARLAVAKARAGWQLLQAQQLPPLPVLAADTSVVLDGVILGKPGDRAQGLAMLRGLSGTTHRVMTAICLYYDSPGGDASSELLATETVVSEVTFGVISTAQIEAYWDSGEPLGKAGGYAIQGFGGVFVEYLRGSYSSVVGLPLAQTYQLLERMESTIAAGDDPQ